MAFQYPPQFRIEHNRYVFVGSEQAILNLYNARLPSVQKLLELEKKKANRSLNNRDEIELAQYNNSAKCYSVSVYRCDLFNDDSNLGNFMVHLKYDFSTSDIDPYDFSTEMIVLGASHRTPCFPQGILHGKFKKMGGLDVKKAIAKYSRM